MPTINKPGFPSPSISDLKGDLDKLGDAIEQSQNADGTVDVGRLDAQVDATGDRGLELSLDTIKDAFQRVGQTTIDAGCGPTTRNTSADPTSLDVNEVQTLLQALTAAKSRVNALDSDQDGALSKTEARGVDDLTGFAGKLATSMVTGSLTAYEAELNAWRDALTGAYYSVAERKGFETAIDRRAAHHAASDLGAEAIRWAYRDKATRGGELDGWKVEGELQDAENSFLRFIPLFGIGWRAKTAQGHLSDHEIAAMFGTDDLATFIQDKKEAIQQRVGDYAADFLEGKDIANVDQLSDPDFKPTHTGCG